MDSVIYYFSGTGNSLYVARQLEKKLPSAKLIPVVNLLSKEIIRIDAEIIGIVFPLHGMTIPVPINRFLSKADIKSSKYIFAVATRGGTKCFAFAKIKKLLKKKKKTLDAHFVLNMASNDPKFADWEVATKKELAKIEKRVNSRVDAIAEIVLQQKTNQVEDVEFICDSSYALEKLISAGVKYAQYNGGRNYFYADSNCIGCGICAKVCPSKKVVIKGSKPVWQNNVKCYFCYACINYCPQNASQIKSKVYMKSYTDKKGRYTHPYATVDDISNQK